jgi:hypothetical protein
MPTQDEEDRIVRIAAEPRVIYVEGDRVRPSSLYPRTVEIPAENRTYVVEFTDHG